MNATAPPGSNEDQDRPPEPYTPRLSDTVVDTAANRPGRVVGFSGPYVHLRPIGGGNDWLVSARAEHLLAVTASEALSAGVAVANARSRGECL